VLANENGKKIQKMSMNIFGVFLHAPDRLFALWLCLKNSPANVVLNFLKN